MDDVVPGDDDDGVAVVGSTFDGPRESRETSRTADTRIATTATPIAPIASSASFVRYQGSGSSAVEGVRSCGSS
jgi:hypothetical protein